MLAKKILRTIVLLLIAAVIAAVFFAYKSGIIKIQINVKEKPSAVLAKVAQPAAVPSPKSDRTLFDFEKNVQDWWVPDWTLEKEDHVARSVEQSQDVAKEGTGSLKVMAEFPGTGWTGAYVEVEDRYSWREYGRINCSIYLPETAPQGLRGRFILTVGSDWKFTEMSQAVYLEPGTWTEVSANLLPGSEDWKMTVVDDAFRQDIRKVGIRVESNKKPGYSGPVYIDDIRLSYK